MTMTICKWVWVSLSFGIAVMTAGGCDEPIDEAGAIDDVDAPEEEEADTRRPAVLVAPQIDPEASTLWWWASAKCTTGGGGTWGSILKFCVNMSNVIGSAANEEGIFQLYKKDGSKFTTPGTFYLRRNGYAGPTAGAKSFSSGVYSTPGVPEHFFQSVAPNSYVDYYAYLSSSGGGYAWAGPIRIQGGLYP